MTDLSQANDSVYEDDIQPVQLKVVRSKQNARIQPKSRNFDVEAAETATPLFRDEEVEMPTYPEEIDLRTRQRRPPSTDSEDLLRLEQEHYRLEQAANAHTF